MYENNGTSEGERNWGYIVIRFWNYMCNRIILFEGRFRFF